MVIKARKIVAITGAALAAVSTGQAADVNYSFEGGVSITDNVLRQAANEQDETVGIAGFNFSLEQDSARVQAEISASAEFRSYFDNTVSDETLATFNGNANFVVVPNVFSWQVSDNYGRALRNVFEPDSPLNRENVNRFSTGPIITIRASDTFNVEITGEYTNLMYEDTPNDVDQISGSVGVFKSLTRFRTIGIRADTATIDFDNAQNSEYDRDAAYLSFRSRTGRSSIAIELGFNEVETEFGKTDGTLVRLDLTRNLTSRTTVALGYRNEIGNSSDLFESLQTSSRLLNETSNLAGSDDPIEIESFNASLNFNFGRSSVFLDANIATEDNETSNALDRERFSVGAGFSRELGGGWSFNTGVSFSNEDFVQSARENDDLTARLGLSKSINSRVSLQLSVEHLERDSTALGGNSDENTARLTLRYKPR